MRYPQPKFPVRKPYIMKRWKIKNSMQNCNLKYGIEGKNTSVCGGRLRIRSSVWT